MVARFAGRLITVMARRTVPGDTAVIEGRIGEGVGVVAIVAGITALDMVRRFARCGAAVMTADAASLNLVMINPRDGRPVARYMTGFADVTGGDMVCIFAWCSAAIMTGNTVAGDAAVVKHGIGPAIDVVAILTGVAAWNVVVRFAIGDIAVMTVGAGALHLIMVYFRDR